MSLRSGSVVGTLEVGEELARGGFGVVYHALDRARGGDVALKVLHADLVSDLEVIRRFEREIRVIQLIGHPNIVKILDVGSMPSGEPFFSMELLAGETLEERIRRTGRLAPDEVLAVLEPLCSALAASHAKGVIHRDLKASNVFLGDRVVLLDFGIAKLVEETGVKITSSRHVIGTPSSMAPEQILGGPLDQRTDVYGLGALAYLMLTAEPPFSAANVVVLQEMQLHRTPAPPSDKAPIRATLESVVLRALAKDAADRQPSVMAFLDDLRAAIGGGRPAASGAVSGGELTMAVVDIVAHVDPETASEETLAAIDELLPALCRQLPGSLELVRRSASSVLVATADGEPDDVAGWLREALADHDPEAVSISIHIHRGPRERLDDLSWVPRTKASGVTII